MRPAPHPGPLPKGEGAELPLPLGEGRGEGRPPLLSLSGVSKRYGGVRALSGVDFSCRAGSIHAVLGENGAGKSTLIKIISGVVQPDEGTITLDGSVVNLPTRRPPTPPASSASFRNCR